MTGPAERTWRTSTRVRYPETDRMGVAHHTHYLVWFELGRTELMRDLGCPYGEVEDARNLYFPVVEVSARFSHPARYDQVILVDTSLSMVNAVRVTFRYTLTREDDGTVLATGQTVHAVVGANGKPTRLPSELRTRLAEACGAAISRETVEP